MDKKQIITLAIAVIFGFIGVFVASSYITSEINRKAEEARQEYEAKQKEMVTKLQMQQEQKLAAMQQQIQQANAQQQAAIQKQLADIQGRLQKPAEAMKKPKPSLALRTPEGKRAVTIKVDSLAAVGGLLNPGDIVDVIATLKIPQGLEGDAAKEKQPVTAMIFQGLQVLAVNTNLEETGLFYDEQQKAQEVKVTVAVSPEEAGLLSFSDKNGRLELALRSPQEVENQMVKSSTWKTLADYVLQNHGADLNLPEDLKGGAKKEEEEQPEKPAIQIFRGGKEL